MRHAHKCGDCSHVWEHETPNTNGMSHTEADRFYDAQHCCPTCKSGPWKEKFYRNEKEREEQSLALLAELEAMNPVELFLTLLAHLPTSGK